MKRGLIALVLAVSLAVPGVVAAAPAEQGAFTTIVLDENGVLHVLADGSLRPAEPPIASAQFLARFVRGEATAALPGLVVEAGELVRSATGSLWWLTGRSRHEVQPVLRSDDPVLMELPVGEPIDLTGAEDRAERRLIGQAMDGTSPATGATTAQGPAAPTQPTGSGSEAAGSSAAAQPAASPTAAASSTTSDAVAAALAAGRAAILNRQFDQAIATLQTHDAAGGADVLAALGEAYRGRSTPEDLRKAIDYYTKAIAAAPDVPRHYRGRAMSYKALGRNTRLEAIADFQRAIDAALRTGKRPAPGDYTAIADLLRLLARQTGVFDRGKLDEASKAATTAMGYDNNFTPAYVIRALVKASSQEGGSAQDIQRAFQTDPGSTDPQRAAWHALAAYWSAFYGPDISVRGRTGQYFSESWTYWDKYISVLESDPRRIAAVDEDWEAMQITPEWAYYNRGVSISWEDTRDRNKVLADFGRAIQLNPREPDFWFQRGRYYYNIGAPAEAKQDLRKYNELMGSDDDGNKSEAAAILRKLGS